MKPKAINTQKLVHVWDTFQKALPVRLSTIQTEADYDRMVVFMNGLLDSVGDDEAHPLADLLDLTAKLVAEHEYAHNVVADTTPQQVLRFLMNEHGLKQSDLTAEVGGQSVVGHILKGSGTINAKRAKALAARFGVSVEAFL